MNNSTVQLVHEQMEQRSFATAVLRYEPPLDNVVIEIQQHLSEW